MQAVLIEGNNGAQPLHCHEEIEIAAVVRGSGVLRCGGVRHSTAPGMLTVVLPQEAHGGIPGGGDFVLRVLNLPVGWIASAGGDEAVLSRTDRVIHAPETLAVFQRAHRAVSDCRAGSLQRDHALLALCTAIVPSSHANGSSLIQNEPTRRGIQRVVTILRDRFSESHSLSALAEIAGVTPWHFCRSFKAVVGMTPHAYQNALRVARAAHLLRNGVSPAQAAVQVGFYDQSHLTGQMRRLLSTTPRQIAQSAISSYPYPL